jgi:hypothetical protein
MIPHAAVGIHATKTWAGVLTLPIDAGLICWTVRIDCTLWPTIGWRSNHVLQASAATLFPNDTRWIAVWSAWIWITRILSNDGFNRPRWLAAGGERISHIARHTDTVGDVVDNLAVCICTTVGPRAGIHTFLLLASLIRRTFRVAGALRSAGNIWITKVTRHTLAGSCSASCLADSI